MRWRFTDRVLSFRPWEAISGVKAVSLEEYHLLKPLGRDGSFPESLVLEACVELGRWLASASSDFTRSAVPSEIEEFHFDEPAGIGSMLRIDVDADCPADGLLRLTCRVSDSGRPIARGHLLLRLIPLTEVQDARWVAAMWAQLRGEPGPTDLPARPAPTRDG